MGKQFAKFCLPGFGILFLPALLAASPAGGTLTGKVVYRGAPPKPKVLDVSKEPVCARMHAGDPLYSEALLAGPANSLQNVVVFISAGPTESSAPPASAALFDQKDCHYATHVLAVRTGQEVKISNSDPISHNIHPLAKINREWNRIQPAGTPPFAYSYDKEEFIPVKCNIHPWMQGYFAVLKTSHFAVTGEDGSFVLPDLPPGKYTVTAWQESYGTQSREITVTGNETQSVNFVFTINP